MSTTRESRVLITSEIQQIQMSLEVASGTTTASNSLLAIFPADIGLWNGTDRVLPSFEPPHGKLGGTESVDTRVRARTTGGGDPEADPDPA